MIQFRKKYKVDVLVSTFNNENTIENVNQFSSNIIIIGDYYFYDNSQDETLAKKLLVIKIKGYCYKFKKMLVLINQKLLNGWLKENILPCMTQTIIVPTRLENK